MRSPGRRGIVAIAMPEDATAIAPVSGLQLGLGQSGAVSMRLFRTSGTRIALAARALPAQLIALRAATSGVAVHVLTARLQLWQPVLRHGVGTALLSPGDTVPVTAGPSVLIDDRPPDHRDGGSELRPWQCRVDVRTNWGPGDLPGFAHADLAVFGAIDPRVAGSVAAAFGVPTRLVDPLARLDSRSFGILLRGRVEYVSLNPTSAEAQVLELARSATAEVGATVRRSELRAGGISPG